MPISTITLDLDGVYFPNGKTNFVTALGKLGVSKEEATRIFLKSPQMNQQYKLGQMSDEQFWSWAQSEWKLTKNWPELIKILIDSYDVDSQVVQVVQSLRQNGYKTAICSNNFPSRIHGLHEKFQFLDNFDVQIFSYDVGASKPSERIFQELISKSNTEPANIIFADDNPDNLAGAQKLGITTFVYENFDKYLEQLKSLGVKI